MEDIIIFITKKRLINQQDGQGLFHFKNVETLGEHSEGYKLKDKNIFAFPCLDNKQVSDKKEPFKKIIKSVCDYLHHTSKSDKIDRFIIFAHGFDVNIYENLAPVA